MRVVMAASEAVPFAKTGGLADVVGALPRALKRLGVDVSVVIPAYSSISADRFALRRTEWTLSVPASNQTVTAGVLESRLDGDIPVYLIEADQYFARPGLYGTPDGDYLDNAERFAFFGRAVPALLTRLGAPDVLHCHDWQTALAPVFLRADAGRYPQLERTRTVLTIHNLGYQGLFWHFDWHLLNIDWRYFTPGVSGVLWQGQLPQRRHRLRRRHHDGEPYVCRGDPNPGVRSRPRGGAGGAPARADRNSQRRRL